MRLIRDLLKPWRWIDILAICGMVMSVHATAQQREVVSFVYHRFGDGRYPSTNIETKTFETHLRWLKANNYTVMTLSDAIRYLDSNEPIQKVAVLTIDDGYKSFYTKGLPLLKKYGMTGTLFINSKSVGAPDYMDWEQLKEVQEAGIEIGNHTHSHAFFMNLPDETRYQSLAAEIEQCQQSIKQNLSREPSVFSYPYGEFDEQMKRVVKEAGFVAAMAQNSGVITKQLDRYLLPRFPMSESYALLEKFIEKAKMHGLIIQHQSTQDHRMPPSRKPELEITFDAQELNTNQLQCFVQGSTCQMRTETSNGQLTLKITAKRPLASRRALYTITVPGKKGGWYWYSFLWINPAMKED